MNSIRYIITRSCLQEGTMRLLKYNERHFPQSGPAQFVDDQGREWAVQIDRERMRVSGLRNFYRDHNLGVNDVMLLTPLAPSRYQAESIVKPHTVSPTPRLAERLPEVQRVVVSSTPHVREVRLQRAAPLDPPRSGGQTPGPTAGPAEPAQEVSREVAALFAARPDPRTEDSRPAPVNSAPVNAAPVEAPQTRSAQAGAGQPAPVQASSVQFSSAPANSPQGGVSGPPPLPTGVEDQLAELARLTGYAVEHPASGLVRLRANLGPLHGYSVLIAADPLALSQPAWEASRAAELDESGLLVTHENERPEGLARLTREALVALIEHARLTPLSPIDLRGYWRAGNLDLESAASISELVSAHLAQRGAFSFVLLSLAGYRPHSVVTVRDLAARLGSGVNTAELNTILDTLSRPPFSALTPLQGGQFLLRSGMGELLGDLADYAQGIRRRIDTPQSEATATTRQTRSATVSA